ncbi:MAG: recombinase family protein [Actinomycetota bacterium]|nr:recombinase family protein [Actinomycetota bacterium]
MTEVKRRAVGITRVSFEGGRQEARLYSYDTQADAIRASCEQQGMTVAWIGQERAVSGGADLVDRPQLSRALEAVEAGEADVIVAAYVDRFFRSLAVQAEVIARVERAGGELLALDHGRLTNGSAAERLQANVLGAIGQFYREQGREKSRLGQAAAVERGAVPWSRTPLGYTRRSDGTLEPNAAEVELVRECFRRRLAGESHMAIRGWLREQGVDRSPRGVQQLLESRIVLGELHFGDLENLHAHEPIVDRELFAAVQRMRIPRGPQPKSDRLLARLRVVRCGSCGSPLGTMVMRRQGDYPVYRCGSHNDCSEHVTIAAEITEAWVWERVKERLAGAQGSATGGDAAARLTGERDGAQERLDRAVRSLGSAGLLGEPASVETLAELRAERDRRQEALDELPPAAGATLTVPVDDDLPDAVRRDLIRATVRAVRVAPSGRGGSRGVARLAIEFH